MILAQLKILKISHLNIGQTQIELLKEDVGDHVFILDAMGVKKNDLFIFLDQLNKFLQEKNISSFFPYPLYIKTLTISEHPYFTIIQDDEIGHLGHGHQKNHGPEHALQKKCQILLTRIKKIPFDKNQETLTKFGGLRKKLFQLCDQNDHLEVIKTKLKERIKGANQ